MRLYSGFMAIVLCIATQTIASPQSVSEGLNISRFDLQQIEVSSIQGSGFRASLNLDGLPVTLHLRPVSLRADGFQLLVEEADGRIVEVEAPASRTFRGSVEGQPDSRIAGSVHGGEMKLLIWLEDGSLWTVQPLSEIEASADPSLHVVYSSGDIQGGNWSCGTDALQQAGQIQIAPPPSGGAGGRGTGFEQADIAFDADFEFYQSNGSSVANTMHDIENIMVGVEEVYERDTQITYEVTVILVRTAEPDPYSSTNPGTLLNQFRNHWNADQQAVQRDVAHLMTGKNLNGGIIGVAWLSVICNSISTGYGYGLSQSKFTGNYNSRVALTAHELGHNWSADHCDFNGDCHIMCSGLGGCNGLGAPEFGTPTANGIINYRNSRNCLSDLEDPRPIPFVENFPSTTLDTGNWSYNKGAQINSNAVNEPSPPHSVNLDAINAGENQDDDLRTNFILLDGAPTAEVSYWTQHRGVENGEQLIVDYWNNDLTWVTLNTITSNGVDQNNFVEHTHTVPADGLHDEFRLRFRPAVNNSGDEWYVDDVVVNFGDCFIPEHYGNPTPGFAGVIPPIDYEGGLPLVGNPDFRITAEDLYGQQTGFLFVGFSRQTVNIGADAWLNVLPPWITVTFNTGGALPIPGQGSADIPFPIPNDASLDGTRFMVHILAIDPMSPNLGLIGTDAIEFEICE